MSTGKWKYSHHLSFKPSTHLCSNISTLSADSKKDFAKFLQAATDAKAFWYSVNDLHEDIPSMSRLLLTSQTNCEGLLTLLGFAQVYKDGRFAFKRTIFQRFLDSHGLTEDCELTQHYVDGYTTQKWFIRVGSKNLKDILQPGTKGVAAPRIHFIERIATEFKKATIRNDRLQDPSGDDARSPISPDTNTTGDGPSDLILAGIQSQLLPLLLFTTDSLVMKQNIDATAVENILQLIVKEANARREEELSSILKTNRNPVSPASENKISFCPMMKQYGIPLEDRRVHADIQRDLIALNQKFESGGRRNLISYEGWTKGPMNLVSIPLSTNYEKVRLYARRMKWVENLLLALGGEDKERETLLDLLSYFARTDSYKAVWEEAVHLNGYPIPRIDEVTTKAIQSMANINREQMRQLRSCLKTELGSPLFATEYKISRIVNLEYVEPVTGTYKYGSERIPWSYKSVSKVLLLWLQSQFTGAAPDFKQIDICINLDHGKGHSRISGNFLARWKNEDDEWCEESHPCALGNARCKKDNAEIISNTFGKLLDEDLKKIREFGAVALVEGKPKLVAASNDGTIPLQVFCASDILLYAIALGKEGSAGWWCTYCKLFKPNWQSANHELGELWTIESLRKHSEDITSGEVDVKIPQDVKGVKTSPVFSSIPLKNYMIPILHITIGKGNDILNHLCNGLQAASEWYTDGYIEAQRDIETSTFKLKEHRDQLANFLMVNRDYMKSLKKNQRRSRSLPPDERELVANELADMEEEQQLLQQATDKNKESLAKAKEKLSTEKKLDANSKAFGQPVHAKLDEILYKHGIDRSGMFGGAIDGNACRRLMGQASSIVSEIQDFVLQQESRIAGITDDSIRAVCDAHKAYLQALDGYLSGMNVKRFHLTPEVAEMTKKYRDKCLELERYLQLSITPKSHVMEDHSCEQQQLLQGMGDLDESFGERNHQYESIADRRHGGTRDFARREKIKSKEQAQFNHPDVKIKVEGIHGKRKRTASTARKSEVQQTADKKRQKRMEDREASLLFFVAPGSKLKKLEDERKRLLRLAEQETTNENN
jgi:hypothetical protein